ncbi:MAG TPA: tetratricopeptide repeat protein [Thermoplasmata archaeon]|nr:tetratricopeptide repeat protein [Thermoplasmata archaeon]
MAAATHSAHHASAVDEVRSRYRAVEEAEPGHDRTRYVEALKAFLATAERHADAIAGHGRDLAPLLDEAAMALYRASDPELAERAVDLGLRLSPGTSTLLHHKALVLLALNRDLPEVVRLVDQALEANPHDRGLWATRGDALRILERPDDAAEAYVHAQELDLTSTEYVDRALKVSPHHPAALRLKVDLARAGGGDLQALAAAEELLAGNPDDPVLRLSRAQLLASVGRREEALAAVRELRDRSGEEARRLEVRLLFDLGRPDEALPLARALVDADPPPAPATLEEIAAASTASHPELALVTRARLGKVDPRNVQNLLDLRLLAVTLGRSDVALEACRAVLEANPENLDAMRGIAEIDANEGRTEAALEGYHALAKSHPHAVGELRKALALARGASRPADVRAFAEAILAVEPADAEARADLAQALAASGEGARALEEYDALLAAHPGDVAVLLAKRDLLVAVGDRSGLVPVLDELFNLDPTRTDVAVERGHLYLTAAFELPEGSPERHEAARGALVSYERASSDPDAVDVSLLGIARASRVADDPERALRAYGDFLAKEANARRLDVRKERAHALREAGRLPEAAEEYDRAISGGLEDDDLLWGAADTLARLGQGASALRLIDVLLRREPNEPMFLRRKGQLLLVLGRRDEALKILQQAVEGAASDPQAFFEVGEALRAQGAYPDAVGYFRKGLEVDPKHHYGRVALAETLLLAGRCAEALAVLDPFLKEEPNDLSAWKARADAWRALGRPSEVLYSLEAILLLDPENPTALLEMFRLRRERGETKEAYDALERLLKTGGAESRDAALLLEDGDLASSLGLPDAANAAYERAAAIDPAMRGEIAIRRARLRVSAGRPDLALEVLDATLAGEAATTPPSIAALLLRADLLASLERPSEARAAYEEVRKREPKSPTAAAGIARAMIAEGRHADAIAFLEEALPRLPPEDGSFLLLAEAESGLGHLEQAASALARGLDALPRSVALWSRLGEVAIARQEWPEAAGALAHALAITPGSVELLLRAGFVAERLGHPNEALAFYERATGAEPNHAQAWTSHGLALLALGRPADAGASFDRALSIDSDFAPAKDGRKLAAEKTRDDEIQRYGREALLLEARLGRTLTKNDLFVSLHVPYEFLTPVLREIGLAPKVDLPRLAPEEAKELDVASYHLITAALENRPAGIERRGFTLADVAALSPPNATLAQMQRSFGYLRAVLEAEIRPEQLSLPPDVEELARKALTLPPEARTLFQLVRTLRVGVYKARLIKAVEAAGAATGTRAPALDLGAYSPEFRQPEPAPPAPAASDDGARFFAPETRPPPSPAPAVVPIPSAPGEFLAGGVPLPPPRALVPMTARAGDRCLGCGGLASVVHACGAALCQVCIAQFPKCPKCISKITPASTRPIPPASRSEPPAPKATATAGSLGGLKTVFRRERPKPPEAPRPTDAPPPSGGRAAGRRAAHRADHGTHAKEHPAPETPSTASPKKPSAESAPKAEAALAPKGGVAAPPKATAPPKGSGAVTEPVEGGAAGTTPTAPVKNKPRTDDEPRL